MEDISHQNPNFNLSKHPHKLTNNKHFLIKTKPTKRSPRSNKNKIINNINKTFNTFSHTISNNNNKPLKVVHISNPIKVEATPTEFRDLVHKLTGRDAVVDDWFDDVNHRATVAVSVGGGVSDDDVITSLSACFGPSDHLSFDWFGPFDHGDIGEEFQALIGDN